MTQMKNKTSILFIIKQQILCLFGLLKKYNQHVLSKSQIIMTRLRLKDFFHGLQSSTRTRDRHDTIYAYLAYWFNISDNVSALSHQLIYDIGLLLIFSFSLVCL